MPDYRVSGEKKGDIWVKSGVIRSGNSRKPVFGFRLLGERLFCKGLNIVIVGIAETVHCRFPTLSDGNKIISTNKNARSLPGLDVF